MTEAEKHELIETGFKQTVDCCRRTAVRINELNPELNPDEVYRILACIQGGVTIAMAAIEDVVEKPGAEGSHPLLLILSYLMRSLDVYWMGPLMITTARSVLFGRALDTGNIIVTTDDPTQVALVQWVAALHDIRQATQDALGCDDETDC